MKPYFCILLIPLLALPLFGDAKVDKNEDVLLRLLEGPPRLAGIKPITWPEGIATVNETMQFWLSVVFDLEGNIVDAYVKQSTHPEMDEAVRKAVSDWRYIQWRYIAFRVEDVPTTLSLQMKVVFAVGKTDPAYILFWQKNDLDTPANIPLEQHIPGVMATAGNHLIKTVFLFIKKNSARRIQVKVSDENGNMIDKANKILRAGRGKAARRNRKAVNSIMQFSVVYPRSTGEQPIWVGLHYRKLDSYAQPIETVSPHYPMAMRRAGFVGRAVILSVVGKDGRVIRAEIEETNHELFAQVAMEAFKKWRFKPAMIDGKPVVSKIRQPMIFKLRGVVGKDPYSLTKQGSENNELLDYDEPPKVLNISQAVYPFDLLKQDIQGSAKIYWVLDEQGTIRHPRVLSTTHPEFGYAAAAEVMYYKFEPALKNGDHMALPMSWEFKFEPQNVGGKTRALLRALKENTLETVNASELDKPPRPFNTVKPKHPYSLRATGTDGYAVIKFLVDEEGLVRFPQIKEASAPEFGYAAACAVAKWHFDPPTSQGKAVNIWVQLPFRFNLESEEERELDSK